MLHFKNYQCEGIMTDLELDYRHAQQRTAQLECKLHNLLKDVKDLVAQIQKSSIDEGKLSQRFKEESL